MIALQSVSAAVRVEIEKIVGAMCWKQRQNIPSRGCEFRISSSY
jgi:hypothetical protein